MDDNNLRMGNASPALTFIFTMLTVAIWGNYAGIYSGPAAIGIGLLQLACYIPYIVCSVILYINKNGQGANIFMIFAVLFGGVGSALNIFSGFAEINGWAYAPEMSAIPFFWGALAMIPFVWSTRKELSKVSFICFTGIILFLSLMMLPAFNIGPVELENEIIKWLMLIVAVTGVYTMMSDLNVQGGGKPYPQGKPFFK